MTRFRTAVARLIVLTGDLTARPIIRNTGALYASTLITSALGFVFWFMAAKLLTPVAVGTASAVQSACQAVAGVAIFGLGTLTIAELAESKARARQVISTAAIVAGVLGTCGGLCVAIVLVHASEALRPALEGVVPLVVFAALSGTTTMALLLDDAAIGLLRGDIQLRRNVVFAASKLLLLPAFVLMWRAYGGTEVVVAWLAGSVLSVGAVVWLFHSATHAYSWKPAFQELFRKRSLIYRHHWLNVSVLVPRQLLPVFSAAIVGPAATAGLYMALLVVGVVNIIPSQLATTLFALKPGDEEALAREVRGTMMICVALACISGPFFAISSSTILHLFQPSYMSASRAMAILGFGTLPSAIKAHYIAIARVHGDMQLAAVRTTIAAGGEVLAAAVGCSLGGVTGLALGLLLIQVLESAVFSRTVVKTLKWRVERPC